MSAKSEPEMSEQAAEAILGLMEDDAKLRGFTQTTQGGVHGTYVPVIKMVEQLVKVYATVCKGISHIPDCDLKCEDRFRVAVTRLVDAWDKR